MAHETFGISVIEAQACSLPVVGVNAGAMPERVPPSLGLLGPVDDPEAMTKNITSIWTCGDIDMMGQDARGHVETHFSWAKTFAHLYGHIYANAVKLNVLL